MEHLFEHITYVEGERLLSECLRVLKPGGSIRISTPSLTRIMKLCTSPGSLEVEEYLNWALEFNGISKSPCSNCRVFNRLLNGFGHKFVYDENSLRFSMYEAGFRSIIERRVGESDDPVFVGVEGHSKLIGVGPNLFETMAFQAQKPV